ncbi:uncharacterized protein [Typha latifolia]|uniref:uncharacterized protein n=1 Tax=Typha latifolia TaxID=4733 RepID=UPI003C2B257C
MEDKEIKSPTNPRNPPRRASQAPTSMAKESILSPGFRSAAEMAGWDEEALLLASLVVEDTPVRDSRHKKRSNLQFKSPPTTNSNRKRRSRRRSDNLIPPLVLALDDDEQLQDDDAKDSRGGVVDEEKKLSDEGSLEEEKSSSNALPCMDRLREELSCAICLEICFEPSTTPCGHSFCMKCLKHSAAKCGKRCPKCRQLISNGRSCTVNTVLWNTIQLLFPEEVEARKNSVDATPRRSGARDQGLERSSSTHSDSRSINTRSFTRVSRMVDRDQNIRRRAAAAVPSQSEDVALAYRLQREEFMVAFQTTREQQRNALLSTRANLRAMASRAIHIRTRSRPI